MPNLRSKTWTTTTPATVGDAQYWEDHLISDSDAAKIATSVQTVNNTAPDASGNVDVVALPAGGTTGQVLTKISNTSGDADWLDPASGGHAIENDVGTLMTQQPTLQFVNADVSNDSVNSKTVVDCKGAKGDAATVTVGTTSTLPAGSSATVTNSGTTSAAVFNFGIPAGEDGTDGEDGVSVTGVELISTSGKVKTYRMTFSDGNHFDYQVTDGADGSGAGDMLKADYDSDSSVYNAGGIASYVGGVLPVITNTYSSTSEDGMSGKAVASAISGIVIPVITNTYSGTSEDGMSGKAVKQAIDSLDVSDSAVSGKYVSAVSETDGKISVTRATLPSVPDELSDLTGDVAISTPADGQVLTYDFANSKWKNQNPASGGHDMIPVLNDIATVTALTDGDDDYVINAYTAKRWSNVDAITLYTTLQAGTDTIGAWNDGWKEEVTPDRSGWIWHTALLGILSDNDVDFQIVFNPADEEAVSLYAYRVDDNYTPTGETEAGGCVAIKFNNAPSTDVTVGISLSRKRTTAIQVTPLT